MRVFKGIKGAKTVSYGIVFYAGVDKIKDLPYYFTCDIIIKNIRPRGVKR